MRLRQAVRLQWLCANRAKSLVIIRVSILDTNINNTCLMSWIILFYCISVVWDDCSWIEWRRYSTRKNFRTANFKAGAKQMLYSYLHGEYYFEWCFEILITVKRNIHLFSLDRDNNWLIDWLIDWLTDWLTD